MTFTREQYYSFEQKPLPPPIRPEQYSVVTTTQNLISDDWREKAACNFLIHGGYNPFHPPSNVSKELRTERTTRESIAKQICAECDVRVECLETAKRNKEPISVWGGLNEKERGQIRKRR